MSEVQDKIKQIIVDELESTRRSYGKCTVYRGPRCRIRSIWSNS